MTGDSGPLDFHQALQRLGMATYSPHQFDFVVDLNPLTDALSPAASAFLFEATAGLTANEGLSPELLYERRWQDYSGVLSEFLELEDSAQVELLTLYTVPLHESRHHIDFLTTPFGARFYGMLAQEYMAFQWSSPFLLQNQEIISAGPVSKLAHRLAETDVKVPADWRESWTFFRATLENLMATVDTRGLEPDQSRATEVDEPPAKVSGTRFQPVSLFGRARSYRVDRRPGWYMRASTLLEGRAVVQSLLWIIDSLGVETPVTNDVLRAYLRANYGPGTGYDYLFLLDLAASWLGDRDFDHMLRRPTVTVLSMLHLVDNAAWFALNAGFHSGPDGGLRPENMFGRFLFALRALREAFREPGVSPYDILIAAESSADARKSGVLPTPEALESAVASVRGMHEHLGQIWQPQMAEHFAAIFSVLTNALTRRYEDGLAFGAGAPVNGIGINALDPDTYVDLFQAYTPGKWVKEWFDFRNRCLFTITGSKVTLTYLREQFGLTEVVVNCQCGSLLSKPVPKWRTQTLLTCQNCRRQHSITPDYVTRIAIPEEVEEEAERLLHIRSDEPTSE